MYPPHSDGGYPLLCQEAAEELIQRGHSVRILTSYYQLERPVTEEPVWRIFNYCPDNINNAPLTAKFKDIVRWYLREFREHSQLKKAMRRFEPELIFVWATKGMSYSIPIHLMDSGLPFFGYVCGYWLADHNNLGAQRLNYQFWQWGADKPFIGSLKRGLNKLLSRFFPVQHKPLLFDHLAYNNEDTLKGLSHPASREPPIQIYDSAPLEALSSLDSARNRRKRLLFIGRLHPSKDPLTLVRACCKLFAEKPETDASLTLVGWSHDEDYIDTLKTEIGRSGHTEQFIFHDPVSFGEMPNLFAKHDLIVVPSAVDPLPRVAAEGMAAGLPLVVSDGTGISKCLEHDKEALIFQAGDVDQLAAQMAQLLGDSRKSDNLANAGRAKALAYFSTNRMVDELESFLNNGIKCFKDHGSC